MLCFFKMKTWRVQCDFEKVFFSIPIPARCKFLYQNLTRFENFKSKLCSSERHQKCKINRFHGVNWTKKWFFGCKQFFKTWHVEKLLIQNLTRCIFFNPNLTLCKISYQNLTRFHFFTSKSDALEELNSKSEKF